MHYENNLPFLDIGSIQGDAPKDFIKAHFYGSGKRDSPKRWPKYLAKVGHKWYPNESIVEYLMTRIGEVLGLNMSKSYLVSVHGQLRFLSKYFLKNDQTLFHGAQIYSAFLNEADENFIDGVELLGLTRELITFKFTCQAIEFSFPLESERIINSFLRLLLFDALVGNNDRHFYNWGVITNIRKNHRPFFLQFMILQGACFGTYLILG
ncbi:MAG: HipA domain-containing protein [Saprospiraceae bacterium]